MTERERILCALSGRRPDRIPWVPRLDLWNRGRRYSQTLPRELVSLSLPQIIERLNVGWYATIPDYGECDNGDLDRALGIFRSEAYPYRVILEGVDRQVTVRGPETAVEYVTPVGSIRTVTTFTEEMRQAGVSSSWITAHAIQDPRDIEVVGYIFSHIKVIPALEGYLALRAQVGDKGLAVAFTTGAACPIQHVMRTLMPAEEFFYAMADIPEKIHWLGDQMEGYFQNIQDIAADSPAEVVFLGGNYDISVTPPPFFRQHILPPLKSYAERLHSRGKYLLTHTDGENRTLLPLYRETEIDIADSICPAPMTSLSLDEIRGAFADRITIWGGIPSTLLCPQSFGWDDFKRFVDGLLQRFGQESHFVLGVSDMFPADGDLDRLQYITDKVHAIA